MTKFSGEADYLVLVVFRFLIDFEDALDLRPKSAVIYLLAVVTDCLWVVLGVVLGIPVDMVYLLRVLIPVFAVHTGVVVSFENLLTNVLPRRFSPPSFVCLGAP